MQLLKGRLHRFARMLLRPVPHVLLSWRFFLTGQSKAVYLHKQAFIQAWSRSPRPVWWLIAVYSYLGWYTFHSWRLMWVAWRRWSTALRQLQGIHPAGQVGAMVLMMLGHGIPPHYYYLYRLYRYPERDWLNFIYSHEIPHWHNMASPDISEEAIEQLCNKVLFAELLGERGLPVVQTLSVLEPEGECIPEDWLCQTSLFFKPVCGSRQLGCMELVYNEKDSHYQLSGTGIEPISGRARILDQLHRMLPQYRYLVQPKLFNHANLTVSGDHRLVTIRLVTVIVKGKPEPLVASLEIPCSRDDQSWHCVEIDVPSGLLLYLDDFVAFFLAGDSGDCCRPFLGDFRVPFWADVLATAECAHESFMDIVAIGWDLAVTTQGVRLLEGNINWGVAMHQLHWPLLCSAYADAIPFSRRSREGSGL